MRLIPTKNNFKNFKIVEDYYNAKIEDTNIKRNITELKNKIVLLDNQLHNIEKSLTISSDLSKDMIETIYNEVGIYFPQKITVTLDDLTTFYHGLIKNRRKKLLAQKVWIEDEKKNTIGAICNLTNEYSRLSK